MCTKTKNVLNVWNCELKCRRDFHGIYFDFFSSLGRELFGCFYYVELVPLLWFSLKNILNKVMCCIRPCNRIHTIFWPCENPFFTFALDFCIRNKKLHQDLFYLLQHKFITRFFYEK